MEHQDFCLHIAAASPLEKYPAKQHARRVAEFLGVEKGLIYLPGAPTAYLEDSDQFVSFRQRRYFYYLSGVDEPDCHLTYDIRLDTLMLYVPAAGSPRKVYYNGRGSTPDEALEKYDIDSVHWSNAVADYVEFWMTQHEGDVYILHPDQAVIPGHDKSPRVNYTKLQTAIDAARVRKDEHEIKLIRKANEISAKAHENVLRNVLKFKNEAQVEAIFLDTCVAADAKHQAYEIIAASGENAATLHYIKNDEPFEDRQVMCLDAGCEWQCYASDVTRTFPLTGQWPSKEAKEIYDLVLKMQTECIEAIRPGARYLDIHYMAHRILIDGLLELGIFHNGTAQEIFDAGTSLAFLPHGLGHHMGLEVHDVSDVPLMAANSRKVSPVVDLEMCKAPVHPNSAALEEGMIVTVEPGIYFNRYALSAVYFPDPDHSKYINREVLLRYLPVGGVRIEDDILVTDDGYENLTTAPKGEEMLRLMQGGLSVDVEAEKPKRHQRKALAHKKSRQELPGALSGRSSRSEGIEAWSRGVPLERPSFSQKTSDPIKTDHFVELEGAQANITSAPRSRPVSLSAAPASFEAIGWAIHEACVAAELPSEASHTPQMQEDNGCRSSHWRKVPPALARMASTHSISNRSLPEYTPSQMFQRPRQAPMPPQKLPELPAKPQAYRQSMPIIISGSQAPKTLTGRPQYHPTETGSIPAIPRYKTLTRGQPRTEAKNKIVEEQQDKRRFRMSENDLSAATAEVQDDGSRQQRERHVTHRASIAMGEQYSLPYRQEGWRYSQQQPRESLPQHRFEQQLSKLAHQMQLQEKQRQHESRRQQHRQTYHQGTSSYACPSGSAREIDNVYDPASSPHPPYSPSSPMNAHQLQDYQMQLMLLEQQNKKRLLMARQAQQDAVQKEVSSLAGGGVGSAMVSRMSSSPDSYYSAGFDMKY